MTTAVYHNHTQCAPWEFNKAMDFLVKRFISDCPSVNAFQIQYSVCATAVPYMGSSKSEVLVCIVVTYKVPE